MPLRHESLFCLQPARQLVGGAIAVCLGRETTRDQVSEKCVEHCTSLGLQRVCRLLGDGIRLLLPVIIVLLLLLLASHLRRGHTNMTRIR